MFYTGITSVTDTRGQIKETVGEGKTGMPRTRNEYRVNAG